MQKLRHSGGNLRVQMDHGVARLAPHVQVSGAGQQIAVLVGASALVCQKAAFEGLFRFQSRYGAVNGAAGRRILPQTGPATAPLPRPQ